MEKYPGTPLKENTEDVPSKEEDPLAVGDWETTDDPLDKKSRKERRRERAQQNLNEEPTHNPQEALENLVGQQGLEAAVDAYEKELEESSDRDEAFEKGVEALEENLRSYGDMVDINRVLDDFRNHLASRHEAVEEIEEEGEAETAEITEEEKRSTVNRSLDRLKHYWNKAKDSGHKWSNYALMTMLTQKERDSVALTQPEKEKKARRRAFALSAGVAVVAGYLIYRGIDTGDGGGQGAIDRDPGTSPGPSETPESPAPEPELPEPEKPEQPPEPDAKEYLSGNKGTTEFSAKGLKDFNQWADDYKVQSGDTIWGLSEQYLEEHGINNPSKYQIDAVKDQVLAEFQDKGIVGENGWLTANETLDTGGDAGMSGADTSGDTSGPEAGGGDADGSGGGAEATPEAPAESAEVPSGGVATEAELRELGIEFKGDNTLKIKKDITTGDLAKTLDISERAAKNLVEDLETATGVEHTFHSASNKIYGGTIENAKDVQRVRDILVK